MTRTDPIVDRLHGVAVPDPYRWLEDNDSAEVVRWMHAQDDLARAQLAKLGDVSTFANRFVPLLESGEGREEPVHAGSRYFFNQRATEAERWHVAYSDGLNGTPTTLIDSLAWRADGSLSLGEWWVSADGKWIAYQVKERNLDSAVLRVMNVDTRVMSAEEIDGAEIAEVRWLPDDSAFFYVQVPTAKELHADRFQRARIRQHKLGDDPARDAVIREASPNTEDPRPQEYQESALSADGHWLIAKVARPGPTSRNDLYFEDLRGPHPRWRTLTEGRAARYWAEAYRDRFYVISDEDAPNQRMFVVDPAHPQRDAWREIIAERPRSPLEGFTLVGGRLTLTYSADATRRAEVHALDGRLVREIAAPSLGVTSLPWAQSPDDDEAFYTFTSFVQPQTIMHTSIARGDSQPWHTRPVAFDAAAYEVDQEFFASKDGTRVPMFIVHKRGTPRDGKAPTILTGYGGFRLTQWPSFNVFTVPWLEAGGTLVSVNLRGGFEYGETWHRDGMRRAKQHVFDDFIAAAETLVRERLTSPEHLVASGFSNGGLLVAAVITQRPDLFAAAICGAPLTDMVRFARFGSGGVPEYGDPNDPDDFAALLAYSPAHHVNKGIRYPPILITASQEDERAHPMHARKFAAEMQAATSGGPVLLRVEWNAGHTGADSRSAYAKRVAEDYAFALSFAR